MTAIDIPFDHRMAAEIAEASQWLVPEITSVPDIVRHWAGVSPGRLALRQGDQRVTYAELDADSNRIAQALVAEGAGHGAHVGYLGKNHHRFFAMWFGICKAGGGIAPFNWRSATAELVKLIEDSQIPIIFAGEEFVETLQKVQAVSSHHFRIVAFSADGSPDELSRWLDGHRAEDPHVPLTGTETALLAYTSGTTGRSKGVQLSQDAFRYSFLSSALEPSLRWHAGDLALMVMPAFHLAGNWVTLQALYHGAAVAVLPFFEPTALLRAVSELRPTVICVVPSALQMVLDHPLTPETDLTSIRRIIYAGSPISAETLQAALEVFGCDFVQFYGATEMWIMTLLRPEQHDPQQPESLTSCGSPVRLVEMRVVDSDLQDVEDDVVGEFVARSPMMSTGYWNQPETWDQTVIDGWYRTGDLGRRDAQGLYYVVDRVKDMIITGGENVYSVEVERALAEHEAVVSVAVVGTPDPRWGEKVTAYVVLHPDSGVTEDDLKLHCRGLIANYKVPKVIHIQDALPMTASGKIQKATLRQLSVAPTG